LFGGNLENIVIGFCNSYFEDFDYGFSEVETAISQGPPHP